MANANPPVLVAQGIGHLSRNFFREVGSLFWFIANTFEETFERIQQGRVPFRAASFFRHTQRAGVDSVPLVGLVSFFLGLTIALFLLMPCLSTVSNIAAVFASSLICKAYFSIAFPYFLDLVKDSLLIRDIVTGILKSFLFGLLISAIACYRGLTVKGGAAGVGTSTTSSVVTAITTVIGFDTLYNVVYTTFYPT